MPFKHDNHVKVDMGDLQNEKANLASFLLAHFKLDSSENREGLEVNAAAVSPQELEKMVNKFIYHQNLNSTHWVSLEKDVVKVNRFKHAEKTKESKHPLQPSIIKHGW